MERSNAYLRLAGLLAERAQAEYSSGTTPAEVAELLTMAGIEEVDAESLAWGRQVDLSRDAVHALAAAFRLHEEILGCVLQPVSLELIEFTLRRAQTVFCDPDECAYCDQLVDRTWALSEPAENLGDGEEPVDAYDLCLSALEHLATPVAESGEGDDSPSSPSVISDSQLGDVIAVLPETSRLRVYAFALQELAEATSGQPIGDFAAFARLRSDYLTEAGRAALDAIARAPEGEITSEALVAALGLRDGRALGQVLRSCRRAMHILSEDGHPLSEDPIEMRRPRTGERRFRLRPRALAAWRALLHSDDELLVDEPAGARELEG